MCYTKIKETSYKGGIIIENNLKTGPNKTLWGKKKEQDGLYYWLPLYQHLEDTRGVMGLLWDNWLSKHQKDLIMNELKLNKNESKNFVMFLGAVHDIGKATPAFQTNQPSTVEKLEENLIKEGFLDGDSIPSEPYESHHTIAGQAILENFKIKRDISSIIGAHHGKPIADNEAIDKQLISYPSNYFLDEDENSRIYKKWYLAQKDFFDWAIITNHIKIDNLPNVSKYMQVLLSGLVIVADWISSNQDFFPLFFLDNPKEKPDSKRLEKGYKKWEKTKCWIPDTIKNVNDYYNKTFGFEPNEIQSKIYNLTKEIKKPGIMILEAPMGIGKTEVALVSALQLARKFGHSGLFFGLPTQATSNSMFNRVSNWLEKSTNAKNDKKSIRLSHSKAHLNEDFTKYRDSDTNIDDKNHNIIINDWFSGRKKTTLDDFVVGTIDQFLMMSLKQKHFALRHLGFSKKIVVIDEVHAYDTFMSQYLLRSIEWLGAYKIPIILLSATLPTEKRTQIIKAYLKDDTPENKDDIEEQIKKLENKVYPIITYTDGNKIKQETNFRKSRQNEKEIKLKKEKFNDLNSLLDDLKGKDGVFGIIVNTVRKAQEIAKLCVNNFGDENVILIHSSFVSTDRLKIEKKITSLIGKGAKRPKKLIVVGTQVLEQSLDIDFDLLITEIAPIDLLIQRIGRLHRHKIKRPKNFTNPYVYILSKSFNLEDKELFEKGTEYVYDKYLLTKTLILLPDKIIIPKDIPKLVKKVYDDENNNDPKLKKLKVKKDTDHKNKEEKANIFRIDDPYPNIVTNEKNIIGMLEGNLGDFETDEQLYAQVRDIDETIEIIALKSIDDGYGLFNECKNLKNEIDNEIIAKKIASATITLPKVFSYSYNKCSETIETLENYNSKNEHLRNWRNIKWLSDSLGIIFDENNTFELNGYILTYDEKYGLTHKKKGGEN